LPLALRLLAPSPQRWEFALRLALICALTALVVEFYQTPDPALTVYVVFFLNKPDRTTSVLLNIVFLVLITCYIVALTTAAEAIEKLTLRILGCLLGSAAGIAAIVFITPSLTSTGSLMAVVFRRRVCLRLGCRWKDFVHICSPDRCSDPIFGAIDNIGRVMEVADSGDLVGRPPGSRAVAPGCSTCLAMAH
jgi:hypothetical protein